MCMCRFNHVTVVRALLSLLDKQTAQRLHAGRLLRYQAAEWQVQHYVADFAVHIPPLANMPYDMKDLFDIGFGD